MFSAPNSALQKYSCHLIFSTFCYNHTIQCMSWVFNVIDQNKAMHNKEMEEKLYVVFNFIEK